jgi:hypothetical protein
MTPKGVNYERWDLFINGLKSVVTIRIIPTGFARRKRAVGSANFVGLEFIPIVFGVYCWFKIYSNP